MSTSSSPSPLISATLHNQKTTSPNFFSIPSTEFPANSEIFNYSPQIISKPYQAPSLILSTMKNLPYVQCRHHYDAQPSERFRLTPSNELPRFAYRTATTRRCGLRNLRSHLQTTPPPPSFFHHQLPHQHHLSALHRLNHFCRVLSSSSDLL